VNARSAATKFGFRAFATNIDEVLKDQKVNLVFIGTRHDSHGRYVLDAMRMEKAIFVEKPLAIDREELEEIVDLYEIACQRGYPPFLMVGYNRRFSPAMQAVRDFMSVADEPLVITYRINAGFLPATSWYQGAEQGGRIVGEVCHFVDTMQFLTGSRPLSVFAAAPANKNGRYNNENVSVEIAFANGSVGHISYVANGASAMAKEYMEVFGGGRSVSMDNFKSVVLYESRQSRKKLFSGDKGHAAEMKAVLEGIKRGESPISFESLVATSRSTFAILDSLRSRVKVNIG
jgi:predicted dehydrogenase